MNLWIDDVRPMPDGFDYHAKTAQEAIHLLTTFACADLISFDHDLGEPECGTGYDVAVWIEHKAYIGVCKFKNYLIHSANPIGRKRIDDAMRSAEKLLQKAKNWR